MFSVYKFRSKNKLKLLLIIVSLVLITIYQFKRKQSLSVSVSISTANLSNKLINLLNKYCDPNNLKISPQCSDNLVTFDEKLDYLYNPNIKDDCAQCISNENDPIKKLYIYHHTFWKLSSPSNYELRVLKLNLMSYLATQNLCCTKFYFWKLSNFPQNIEDDLRKEFKFYIDKNVLEFKLFNINSLCKTANLFKNHATCKSNNIDDSILHTHSVGLSDFVRFFVLDQYGGIYTDGDVIYLKNMQLLWYFNFAYRWSFTSQVNTAVLGINRKFDSSIDNLYNAILKGAGNSHSVLGAFHPNEVSNYLTKLNNNTIYNYKSFVTLHGYLFDSAWLCYDGIEKSLNSKSVCNFEQFSKAKLVEKKDFNPKDFFPGAFNYHIHLRNADTYTISAESYMAYFEDYFKSLLNLSH